MSTFAERLKKARVDLRMVQYDLSQKSGVTQSAIAQYEMGIMKPRPDKMKALADALGVDVDWLASDDVVLSVVTAKAANNGDSEMIGKTPGNRLAVSIKNAGIDVKKLSMLTNIPENILNEYLEDKAPLLVMHVEMMASVLGVNKSWLAFGKN
jgi:DNA-binding XRE family transcriptional regulator